MPTPPKSPRTPSKKNQTLRSNGGVPPSIRTTNSSASHGSRLSTSFGKTSSRKPTEAEEAELLSQATAQAMTAARSILLAGGSESTALSTAKAAATSILAPSSTDHEYGKSFLGRRKGKRQAEIVASMALLSVKQTLYQTGQLGQFLPPSAHPTASLSPAAVRTKATPLPPQPPSSRATSPTRRTPFQPPAAERREALGNTIKEQWLGFTRTATPVPGAVTTPKNGSGSQTSSANSSSVPPPILPPTLCAPTGKTDQKLLLPKLPTELPKPRPKTRDLADNLPNEDPIYYNDASTVPRRRNLSPTSFSSCSSSSDSDSSGSNTNTCDTYEDETVQASAIARKIAERNRLSKESGADALLTQLSNLILCGMTDMPSIETDRRDAPEARRTGMHSRDDHEESVQSSGSEDDDDDDEHDNDTSSTVSSNEFLQELDKASFDTKSDALKHQNPLIHASAMTDSIRKTMEQALALASSRDFRSDVSAPPKPVIEERQEPSEPQSTISLKFTPGLDDASAGRQNRLQVLSQRVKFRSWMKRRRGDGQSSGKLPMYE